MPSIDYTHIFEDSLNEIYVFSAETLYFLEVNRGARENLGYTMDELRCLTPLDLKQDYTAATFASLVTPLQDGSQEKIIFETTHHRKDGTFYPVEVHLHLGEIDNKPVFVAIILDITKRLQAEEQAIQLALEQERIRLLHEFIDDVSHDLRTPLTQAGTSLYLLKQQIAPQHHDYIQRIQQALKRVDGMIDSMLQMSALDSLDNYTMKSVNLNRLLTAIVYANEAIAQQRHLTLEFIPGTGTDRSIQADKAYLLRALENILLNALMYTEAGGSITIQTALIPDCVQIKISDTGIGIAPELPAQHF